ncbi:toll/interleukin-1 receptor domain-containing protein [Caproiciproducens sp. NJN-50]|uniref:toll/interleukin-1 receptor domain-containing protein n=1 Tax=Acutalibacteraceae TaxID=3082771 RepID=UPI0013E8BE06
MEKRIFLSYNWNDTKDVNRLDNLFSRFQIHLTRDIRDLKYNANIHNFMDGIRKHDKLILYVSDSYLRSVNCMYEASQGTCKEKF